MRIRALAIALTLAAALPAVAGTGYASMPMDQAAPLMQEAAHPLIVDVREPDEFAAGHVPGALNVPLAQVGTWAKDRAKDEPLLVICQSGRRSLKASNELAAQGFTRVTNVEGGFRAWKERGLPVERPAEAGSPLDGSTGSP